MRVSITDEASRQIEGISDYLESEWSARIRDNFLHKLESAVTVISQMPFSFPESERHLGLRRCVVHKFTSIYYRVKNDEVEILAVVDNRQNF